MSQTKLGVLQQQQSVKLGFFVNKATFGKGAMHALSVAKAFKYETEINESATVCDPTSRPIRVSY